MPQEQQGRPAETNVERRQEYAYMRDELNTIAIRVSSLEEQTLAHRAQTTRIENNTAELIETFNALKGAWTVLNWIGKLAKPVSAILAMGGAWWWLKDHAKDIFK